MEAVESLIGDGEGEPAAQTTETPLFRQTIPAGSPTAASQRWPALVSRRHTALGSVQISAHGLPPSALARLHNPAGNWGLS